MTDHRDNPTPHSGAPMGEDLHSRPSGHERQVDRDINLRGLGITVFALFLGTVIAMFAMWWMFEALLASELASDPEPSPLIEASQQVEPPGPRLQASPERDMEQWRAHQNAIRTSYAWLDRDAGVARIPVGRAMELLAEEGIDSGMTAMVVSPPSGTAAGVGQAAGGGEQRNSADQGDSSTGPDSGQPDSAGAAGGAS